MNRITILLCGVAWGMWFGWTLRSLKADLDAEVRRRAEADE